MRVGILYNIVEQVEKGRDIEKIADNEVIAISIDIQKFLKKKGHSCELLKVSDVDFMSLAKRFDCIFNLAEGIDGDIMAEPLIAKKLKDSGVPFTGCQEKCLALCLDKVKAKEVLAKAGIKTPKYQLFVKTDDKISKNLPFPLIVKPVHEDASIGITKDSVVKDEASMRKIVKLILESYKQPALVEEYIDGREINAAILGNFSARTEAQVLPLSEIVFDYPKDIPKIVSFDAKWIEDSIEYKGSKGKCPADLPENIAQQIRSDARKAFITMGCTDYARVDFRLRDNEAFVLEVNPNPCINKDGAGFVRSAKAAGLDYENLILKILDVAVSRHKEECNKGNIYLKPIERKDAAIIARWFNDYENVKYMSTIVRCCKHTKESVEQELKESDPEYERLFMIYEEGNHNPIGHAGIDDIDANDRRGEAFILIGEKSAQGKGYGKLIAKELFRIAFDELNLNSIFTSVAIENKASIAMVERFGFKRIGIRRDYNFIDGKFMDEIFFDLTKNDYIEIKRRDP